MGLLQRIETILQKPDYLPRKKTFAGRLYDISQRLLDEMESKPAEDFSSKEEFNQEDELLKDWENELQQEEIAESKKKDLVVDEQELARLNKQLEDYLSLFEIAKEVLRSTSYDEYFENLMYAILGQFGVETIFIMADPELEGTFKLSKFDGMEADDILDFTFGTESNLYSKIDQARDILYISELLDEDITKKEVEFLEKIRAEIVVPIESQGDIIGVVFISKMISGEDFSVTDLETLRILKDFVGNYYANILEYEQKNKTLESLTDLAKTSLDSYALADKFLYSTSLEEVYSILADYLVNIVGIKKFSLLVANDEFKEEYVVYGSNLLSNRTVETFKLYYHSSEILNTVSKALDFYKIENFKHNPELLNLVSKEDLAQMKEFWVVPLINLKWMVGLIFIHEVSEDWTKLSTEKFLHLSNIIASVIANIVMMRDQQRIIQNPFRVIESLIDKEILLSTNLDTQFSLLVIKIQNVNRIINLLGTEFFEQYNTELWKIISQNSKPGSDTISKIGQGKYAVILTNTGKKNAELFINNIKTKALSIKNPYKGFNISIQIYLLIYPEQTTDKRKFLEMLEET